MAEPPYTLHVWPPKWNLQSLDPSCLATVMYLQLTIPGKFKVKPCVNPDKSPDGKLPYLTHAHAVVSTFRSITAFVSSVAKSDLSTTVDLDASLTTIQKAELVALFAHAEALIGDLVSHMFYGIDTNFWGLTNPALSSEMPLPQKYYVASRIRESYRPRLEGAGLWSLSSTEEEQKGFDKDKKKKRDYKVTFTRAFEREKILDKAKTSLELYSNFLGEKPFFFGDRPTSLDVYLAAHILLLADPPFPDAVLQIHLLESFPRLVEHARRIQAEVARAPSYECSRESGSLLNVLVPRSVGAIVQQTQDDPADILYRRNSLIFIVGVLATTAVYIYTSLFVNITVVDSEEVEESAESAEGEGENSVEGGEELASGEAEAFSDGEDDD